VAAAAAAAAAATVVPALGVKVEVVCGQAGRVVVACRAPRSRRRFLRPAPCNTAGSRKPSLISTATTTSHSSNPEASRAAAAAAAAAVEEEEEEEEETAEKKWEKEERGGYAMSRQSEGVEEEEAVGEAALAAMTSTAATGITNPLKMWATEEVSVAS
jgi:Mg-chelatase subunit ChlI